MTTLVAVAGAVVVVVAAGVATFMLGYTLCEAVKVIVTRGEK